MVEAEALLAPWQVKFQAGDVEGIADTIKEGVGGEAGMRPHELLEASLATCMTISARMALAELGINGVDAQVRVRVHLEREEATTRFRYELLLDPELEAHRAAVLARIERSPVRSTLSKSLVFEAV